VATNSWWWRRLLLLRMRLFSRSRSPWKEVSSWSCSGRCMCFVWLHSERIRNYTLLMIQLCERCLVQILPGCLPPCWRILLFSTSFYSSSFINHTTIHYPVVWTTDSIVK
jgi:hypothetical protein